MSRCRYRRQRGGKVSTVARRAGQMPSGRCKHAICRAYSDMAQAMHRGTRMKAPRAIGSTTAAILVFCTGIGLAHAGNSADALPETMAMLKHAISIHTVEGQHQVPVLAAYLADKLKAGGFAAADVQIIPVGETAALVARYRGTGQGKPILLSGHMDVVAANRKDWTRDPFTLIEGGGEGDAAGGDIDRPPGGADVADLLAGDGHAHAAGDRLVERAGGLAFGEQHAAAVLLLQLIDEAGDQRQGLVGGRRRAGSAGCAPFVPMAQAEAAVAAVGAAVEVEQAGIQGVVGGQRGQIEAQHRVGA